MTDPFMRVDLSQNARDFLPIALEPGLPLLDRSNSNVQTLRKWLGGLVAEVERGGDKATFYVRDDEGGRLDSVFCVPLSEKDLAGDLAKDFKELQRRIEAAKPQTRNEQLIHRNALEQIRGLSDEANAQDRRCQLLKYRDARSKPHLVWCPGYRRRDNEPAAPLICTSPSCSHLFLQRRETGAKCPLCQALRKEPVRTKSGGGGRFFKTLMAMVLLLALGGAGGWWWQKQQQGTAGTLPTTEGLTVEPAEWTGPVGSQVQFVLHRSGAENKKEVVTSAATVAVANPRILSVKPFENIGKALNPGQTEVTFFVASQTVKASITVEPRSNPAKLILQPDKIELGVGTTAQVRLIGEYADGKQADLTDDAEWEARHDDRFFVHKGKVEGEEAGTGTLRVRYRANDKAEPLEATAEVVVRDYQYKSLKLAVEPESPVVGQPAHLNAIATTESGAEVPVGDSKDLKLTVAPADKSTLHGAEFTASAEGEVKFTAEFRGLMATATATVARPADVPNRPLDVSPKSLELKIGEIAGLNVQSSRPQSVRIVSGNPEIVEVAEDGRVIGRAVGTAEIEVSDGETPVKVAATVAAADWKSIVIEPSRVSLRADDSTKIRVYGVIDDKNRAELAADQLTWVALPRVDFVEFDKTLLQLKGLKPTGNAAERLTARLAGKDATTEIQVVAPPLTLTLSPADSIEIPFGQKREVQVQARYGGAAPVDVPADRVEWVLTSTDGFAVANGAIHAKAENVQTRLTAKYQGATSNSVVVSAVAATPLTLRATADPSNVHAGDAGRIVVTAEGPGGAVQISEETLQFDSDDPNLLTVSETTGAFRAINPGRTTVKVTHPSAKTPAEAAVTIGEAKPSVEPVVKPTSVRIAAGQPQPAKFAVGSEFTDWKVEAVAADGSVSDVTRQSTIEVQGDLSQPTVAYRDGRLLGLSAGAATVNATFAGVRAPEGLRLEVTTALEVDEIRIAPSNVRLAVGETAGLHAEGFRGGRNVGLITRRSDLTWKAKEETIASAESAQVAGVAPGTTTVTASFGKVVSNPATITVVPEGSGGAAATGRLTASPNPLRLHVGEVARLGTEITVRRGEVDFSEQCEVAPPSSRIVEYQAETRTVVGVSPGRTRMTFTVRDQAASIDMEVLPPVAAPAQSTIVIEPAAPQLAVGERLPIRVFLVTPDGRRTSANAALSSSNNAIAAVLQSQLEGLTAGEVTLEARVPGIAQPGRAKVTVEDLNFQQLVFGPTIMSLGVTERKHFEVHAITPRGRIRLGNHPNLKLEVGGTGDKTIELSDASREVLGLAIGRASVVATWKGSLEKKLPVTVKPETLQEIVIQPDDVAIEEGGTVEFQVFARRGDRLQPLQPIDGVQLQIANPVVAEAARDELRVTGLKADGPRSPPKSAHAGRSLN